MFSLINYSEDKSIHFCWLTFSWSIIRPVGSALILCLSDCLLDNIRFSDKIEGVCWWELRKAGPAVGMNQTHSGQWWRKRCLQSAIMDNVLHPLDDKMSMQWSTFSRRLFPLRRAKKHLRSSSDCPPLQFLLPQQHQPLAFRFPLSISLQSVI